MWTINKQKTVNLSKNTKDKPLRTNAAIWYHKVR